MRGPGSSAPLGGWRVWGWPMLGLLLLLLGPLALFQTPLHTLALTWAVLLVLALWTFLISALIGAMAGTATSALTWLECRLRRWVARFARDSEALWLQWARQAHRPAMARWCLDQALLSGGAEALFQEGLAYLEGGLGAGGQIAAVERFRKAAARGHAEGAFRLAEALRTGFGSFLPEPAEAEVWYRRAASKGFGPAAVWLARAFQEGDGVAADETQARHWAQVAEGLQPHQALSRSLLRHDAAPEDPLVRLGAQTVRGLEGGADRLVAHRAGRWVLGLAFGLLGALALLVVGSFFWAGSSSLFHLPLLMLTPPLLMLGWLGWRLRREGPRRGRDRLREAAERGDPEACFQLGRQHLRGGPHLPKDDLGAALWFRKAAEAGHQGAMEALAQAYLGGHGVLRNPQEAAHWAEAARRESTS
jgi:TPR repeat protein